MLDPMPVRHVLASLVLLTLPAVIQQPSIRIDERPITLGDPQVPYVEPVIAVNPADPDHLVGAAVTVGRGWTPVAIVSFDGGATWARIGLARQEELNISGDPWLFWAGDVVYLSVLAFIPWGDDDERVAVWVYRSRDGGRSFEEPVQIPFPERGSFDHSIVVADRALGGRAPIYIVATLGLSGLSVSRSTDGGATFGPPSLFVPDELNNNLGGAVAIGERTVVFTHFDMSTPGPRRPLWAVRSIDGGATFERTLITRGVVPWGFPMLAVDDTGSPRDGRIYSVWLEDDQAGGLRVVAAHSDDLGATWSDTVIVDAEPEGIFRGRPQIAVAGEGIVGISWNDRRHDTGNQCSDVYFAASVDGGATWSSGQRVSTMTSCPHVEPDNRQAGERWPMGGDYSGITAAPDGSFRLIWSDARDGIFRLYTARVAVER